MAQVARQANPGWRLTLSRFFTVERLAIATVALGYILILIGGVVRIEGAGMGCGDDWPICNGKVVPTFNYLTAIEYLHRVVAGLILVLTTWLTVASWRGTARSDARRWLTLLALVLVLAQAGLGAITVFAQLDPRAVTAHLGMAQTYFAIVIIVALLGSAWATKATHRVDPAILRAAVVSAIVTFGLLLTGAYTASSGAAWACPEWPLCGDKYFPTGWSSADVHMLHRWLALLTIVSIGWLLVVAIRTAGPRARATRLSIAAMALLLTEVTIGGANIWFELANWVRISHLAFATLVWGCLIVIIGDALPSLRAQAGQRTTAPTAISTGARGGRLR